jgi:hypothetical protein
MNKLVNATFPESRERFRNYGDQKRNKNPPRAPDSHGKSVAINCWGIRGFAVAK